MEGDFKMKKLLVLVMVLGLVATANAGLCTLSLTGTTTAPAEITVATGSITNIAVLSNDASPQGLLLELDDSAADAAGEMATYSTAVGDWVYTGGNDMGMTKYAAAGDMASIVDPVVETYPGLFGLSGAGVTSPATTGKWFSINYQAAGLGDMYITLYTDAAAPIQTLIVHQTPEPITMTLLGLGGLFLRRRK
jgi:hypothetical protein